MSPRMCRPWALFWDLLIGLIIVAPLILWPFAAMTGKLQTMDAQEYHTWRDVPQIQCAVVGALMKQVLSIFASSYPSIVKVAEIGSLEWCLDMMLRSARRPLTGNLMWKWLWRKLPLISSLNRARQPQMPLGSEFKKTMLFHRSQRRLRQESEPQRLHILRQHSAPQRSSSFVYRGLWKERDSDLEDIITSYLDYDMVAPQGTGRLLDLQNPTSVQPSEPRLQDTVSPFEIFPQELTTDNPRAQAETTSTEVSGTTTSEGDVPAAEVGKIGSTNSLQSSPEGHQANTNLSGGRNDSERRLSFLEVDPLVPDLAQTLYKPSTALIGDQANLGGGSAEIIAGSTSSPSSSDRFTTDGVVADLSGGGNDPEQRLSEVDPLGADMAAADSYHAAQAPWNPFTVPIDDQLNLSIGGVETIPSNTPSPSSSDQVSTGPVGGNLSGGGNEPDKRLSEVDPLAADMAAAERYHTAQAPWNPSTVLTNDQVHSSVGSAETNPGNTPSPPSSSQLTTDGVGDNRDAGSSQDPSVSGLKGFFKSVAEIFKPSHTEDEIIDMAARDYDLEHLKNGITADEFNQRIDKWKEIEDHIVRQEVTFPIPDPLDYGKEWQVFFALQLWFYYLWHRERNGNFPPGYRTLFNSSKDEIFSRSRPTLGFGHSRTEEATRL